MSRFAFTVGGRSGSESFTYGKDNLLTAYTARNGTGVSYTYDYFNRLDKKTIKTTTPLVWDVDYKLSDRTTSGYQYHTTLPSAESLGNRGFRYQYDVLGNITQVEEKDESGNYRVVASYDYDSIGQLIRENSVYKQETVVYTYDNNGNITAKTVYPYTEGTVGSPKIVNAYTYTDSSWKATKAGE